MQLSTGKQRTTVSWAHQELLAALQLHRPVVPVVPGRADLQDVRPQLEVHQGFIQIHAVAVVVQLHQPLARIGKRGLALLYTKRETSCRQAVAIEGTLWPYAQPSGRFRKATLKWVTSKWVIFQWLFSKWLSPRVISKWVTRDGPCILDRRAPFSSTKCYEVLVWGHN
jgi:hypothetical protein